MKLTPPIEAELQRVIHALPEDDLAALARTEPEFLSGGFRANHAAALRIRVLQLATGPHPLSEALGRLLVRHSLNPGCVRLLSAAALTDLRHVLTALFGAPRLVLAMHLDDRAEVRELAGRWMQQEGPGRALEPAAAAAQARETFACLLAAMGASGAAPGASPVMTREDWHAAREQLEQQLRDARAEGRRLKGVEDRLARTREQLTACERDKAVAQAQVAAVETLARQTARELAAARTELEREIRHRAERLTAAVETRLAEEASGWLAAVHTLARETAGSAAAGRTDGDASAAPPPGADAAEALLARAEAALARQAAMDRHSGNRTLLTARLDRLAQRQEQVRDTLAHALQPVPELVAVERDLQAEITRLRRLLDRETAVQPLEATLMARFAVATPNALVPLRSLVAQLVTLGALEAGAAARLTEVLQRRQDVARATTSPEGAARLPAAGDDDASPLGVLRRALDGRQAGVLLVDGHNVLFGLQGRYLPPTGAAVPTAAARTRLIEDVVQLTGGRPTCRAWVVFDGPAHTESTAAANVRVTYSGGVGEHRADLVLLDNVRFFHSVGNTPIVLASNDSDLCAEARRLGAQTVSALEFGSLLD